MNIEEYKTIRDEMLQRFRWTTELLFFAVGSTAALLSWLSSLATQSPAPTRLNPLIFVSVGLGITTYLFFSYRETLGSIYQQGGYLAVFHEFSQQDFRWHLLRRFFNELRGEKSDWGRDGRRGGLLLLLLAIANVLGPVWFLREYLGNIVVDLFNGVMIAIVLMLGAFICMIAWDLFTTARFMRQNLKKWMQIKDNLEKDPSLLGTTIERVLQSDRVP